MNIRQLAVRLYTIGTAEGLSDERIETIQFTNALSITFGCLSVPYAFLMFYFGYLGQGLFLTAYFIGMVCVPILSFKNQHNAATLLLIGLTNFLILFFAVMFGARSNVQHHLFLMVVAPKLLFSNQTKGDRFAFLASVSIPIASLFGLEYLDLAGYIHLPDLVIVILRYSAVFTVIVGLLILVAHSQHISDLNQQKLKLLVRENLTYRAALDRSAVCLFTDLSGKITDSNALFSSITGYSEAELLGNDIRILNSKHHPKEFFENMWRTISAGHIWRGEIRNRAKDGRLYWVDATIVPCFGDSGRIEQYFSIRFDISKRKEAEEMLLQSAKMASLGEMAGGIAHEINTPLAVNKLLVGQVIEELSAEIVDTERIHSYALKIDSTVDRIAGIVQTLRRYSRSAEGDAMVTTSVENIVKDVVGLCEQRFHNGGVEFSVTLPNDAFLDCRPVEISQVFLNLLSNAFDAVEQLAEKWIQLVIADAGNSIEITVTDSGSGIASAVAAKIFQPFFTTKDVGRGTGLGLSISLKIVQNHGGTFRLDPTCPNTRFVISLPKQNRAVGELNEMNKVQ